MFRLTLILAALYLGLGCQPQDNQMQAADTPAPGTGALIVSYSETAADTFAAVGTDSITVLDWLRTVCDSANLAVEIKEYSFGDLVVGIGATHSGDGGDWLYQVNGQMVPEAASSHHVSSGDTVRFFFH
jgi:hypothetical protein